MTATSVAFYEGPVWRAARKSKPSVPVAEADFSQQAVKLGLIDRFRRLYSQWLDDIAHMSSVREMMTGEGFEQMVAMGPDVLPLVLRELQAKPTFLFLVAQRITGHNPVTPDCVGDVQKIVACWVNWLQQER